MQNLFDQQKLEYEYILDDIQLKNINLQKELKQRKKNEIIFISQASMLLKIIYFR